MKRLVVLLAVLFLTPARAWAAPAGAGPSPLPVRVRIVPNDPSQNPLGASGTISAGLSDTLNSKARLSVSVSNPTATPVTFTLAEAIFVQGTQQKGHPLFADRIEPAPLQPGSTTNLRFRYSNPEHVTPISAYVLLQFAINGATQRTALFIAGPQQANLADRWQHKFFPYGHFTGFFSTTDYVQAPYWGSWWDFSPYWWW